MELGNGFGGYHIVDNKFLFLETSVNLADAIGEETSHYLHRQLNPSLFPEIHTDGVRNTTLGLWFSGFRESKIFNVQELIGRYGALVYAQEKGVAAFSYDEYQTQKREHLSYMSMRSREYWEMAYDYMDHDSGYWRAQEFFDEFGDSLLPTLARLNIEEALHALPRLAPYSFYERHVLPYVDMLRSGSVLPDGALDF